MNTSLITKIRSLIVSDDYEDWLQSWELIRENTPDSVTTFDDLDEMFHLNINQCSVDDMLYKLDKALSNTGLDDPSLITKRAEVSRWIYTHFPKENALNLGDFWGYEAEALWALGQGDQAEALFQKLIGTYPNCAWGYLWWGDQYWMSDWSYDDDAPDYDRAESLYRQALSNPALDEHHHVQERLDNLNDEKEHPEIREQIKQTRLKYIQRRQSLE